MYKCESSMTETLAKAIKTSKIHILDGLDLEV